MTSRALALAALLVAAPSSIAYAQVAQPSAPSPWTPPPPLPAAPPLVTAAPPPTYTEPPPVAAPPPAPLPPLRPAARRRMSYSVGMLVGAAIPLTGGIARNLDPGFSFTLAGSDEFSANISGRVEIGMRYHGVASGGEATIFFSNLAGRFYLTRDIAARPYLGAHLGYQIGVGDDVGIGSVDLLSGLSLGVSGGLNYHLSDTFALNAEGRFEGVLAFGFGGVSTGSILSVTGGLAVFIP